MVYDDQCATVQVKAAGALCRYLAGVAKDSHIKSKMSGDNADLRPLHPQRGSRPL
jgi:hypothetical protein